MSRYVLGLREPGGQTDLAKLCSTAKEAIIAVERWRTDRRGHAPQGRASRRETVATGCHPSMIITVTHERYAPVLAATANFWLFTRFVDMVQQSLIGRRVLILDDRPEVAREIARAVHDAGAAVEGPYGDPAEAQAAIRWGGFDSVVMRGELRGRSTASVTMTLRTKGIPIISTTCADVIGQLSCMSRRAA